MDIHLIEFFWINNTNYKKSNKKTKKHSQSQLFKQFFCYLSTGFVQHFKGTLKSLNTSCIWIWYAVTLVRVNFIQNQFYLFQVFLISGKFCYTFEVGFVHDIDKIKHIKICYSKLPASLIGDIQTVFFGNVNGAFVWKLSNMIITSSS